MDNRLSLFIDSGAHSFWNAYINTAGNTKTSAVYDFSFFDSEIFKTYLDNYIKFLVEYKDQFDIYVNLDVIKNAEKTWEIQQYMESFGLSPLPVYHIGEDVKWFKMYMDKYDYIAVGGLGSKSMSKATYVRYFGDEVFSLVCDTPDRMPRVKIHGFALTAPDLMSRYPWYSVDSVSGDSLILIKEAGRIRVSSIEDLYYAAFSKKEKSNTGHLVKKLVDTEVFVPDNFGKGKWVETTSVIRHDTMKIRYRVQASRGRVLKLTGDHGMFKRIDEKSICTSTDQLQKGDFVVGVDYKEDFGTRTDIVVNVPRKFYHRNHGKKSATVKDFPIRIELDNLFMTFLGLWMADGSYSSSSDDGSVGISVANDPECKLVVEQIAKRWNSLCTYSKNEVDMSVTATLLGRILRRLELGRGSHNKEIPWWLFEVSEDRVGSFLKGYFSGDGTAGACVECGSVSKKLVYGTFSLLTKLGIDPVVSRMQTINIGGGNNLKIFKEKIGFLQKYKNDNVDKAINKISKIRGIRESKNENEIYLKCKKIENLGIISGPVYDLEVPEGQRFVANGLLVHNSTSWIKYGAMIGSVLIPPRVNGEFNFLGNPRVVIMEVRSEKKIEEIKKQAFKKVGLKSLRFQHMNDIEKAEIYEYFSMYGYDETVVQRICDDRDFRTFVNMLYFRNVEDHLPAWPWPWKIKTQRSLL